MVPTFGLLQGGRLAVLAQAGIGSAPTVECLSTSSSYQCAAGPPSDPQYTTRCSISTRMSSFESVREAAVARALSRTGLAQPLAKGNSMVGDALELLGSIPALCFEELPAVCYVAARTDAFRSVVANAAISRCAFIGCPNAMDSLIARGATSEEKDAAAAKPKPTLMCSACRSVKYCSKERQKVTGSSIKLSAKRSLPKEAHLRHLRLQHPPKLQVPLAW